VDWEVDPLEMTLNDLEILQKGFGPGSDISKLKEILGRLVTNKTAEEIGALSLRQLNDCLDAAMKQVEGLAVPKATDTP
jgi:hypothetical protein